MQKSLTTLFMVKPLNTWKERVHQEGMCSLLKESIWTVEKAVKESGESYIIQLLGDRTLEIIVSGVSTETHDDFYLFRERYDQPIKLTY